MRFEHRLIGDCARRGALGISALAPRSPDDLQKPFCVDRLNELVVEPGRATARKVLRPAHSGDRDDKRNARAAAQPLPGGVPAYVQRFLGQREVKLMTALLPVVLRHGDDAPDRVAERQGFQRKPDLALSDARNIARDPWM